MACKNCKGKELVGVNKNLQERLKATGKNLYQQGVDKTLGQVTFSEKILLLLFAWIPLSVGYFTIFKFIYLLF